MAEESSSPPSPPTALLSRLPSKRPSAIRDPLLSARPALDDFCYDVSALQMLARQGSWRSVIEKVYHVRKLFLLKFPHEQLTYDTYLILAHTKLRNYGTAGDELDALRDLDSSEYRYEHYPSIYPGKLGSMVPFGLRWLHAELPHRLGRTSVTIERLYNLFNHCQKHVERLQEGRDLLESGCGKNEGMLTAVSFSPDCYWSETSGSVAASLPNQASSGVGELASYSSAMDDVVLSSSPSASLGLDGDLLTRHVTPSPGEFPQEDTVDQSGSSSAVLPVDPFDSTGETVQSLLHDRGGCETHVKNGNVLEEARSNCLPSPDSEHDFGEFVTGEVRALDDSDSAVSVFNRWQRKKEFIMSSIMSHHLSQRDYVVGLKWLRRLLLRHPNDPFLHSKLAYLQMQLGDLMGAKATFLKVENMISDGPVVSSLSAPGLKSLVSRNRGLQHLVHKQYGAAIKEFDSAIEADPFDIVSANNKALCLMYLKDLIGSTKVLENVLERVPVLALNESLVLNLCSMYELAFVNNVGIKKSLTDWIMKIAPDDFDLSCTRL